MMEEFKETQIQRPSKSISKYNETAQPSALSDIMGELLSDLEPSNDIHGETQESFFKTITRKLRLLDKEIQRKFDDMQRDNKDIETELTRRLV